MRRFEELAWSETPRGEISLRRRIEPTLKVDVYEVKLGDEFLMSSLFTVAEIELARLGLTRAKGEQLDVVVGGLGLGYTAQEALQCNRIRSVTVIEYSEAIIDWHERGLLPDTAGLAADSRVRLVRADFFAAVTGAAGFGHEEPDHTYDAILLDIDHSPRHVLDQPHAAFYTRDGLRAASSRLVPGGTFALWSDDAPDDEFRTVLDAVFTDVVAEQIWFDNPLTGGRSANTVYLATRR